MSKYTHVIFDFGGVITASPFEAFNRLEEERGLPRDLVRRINAADPDGNAWAKFERAEIDAAAFDTLFAAEAKALGHDLEGEAVLAVLAGAVRPAMVAALDTLKAQGFGDACITNNVPSGKGAGMARKVGVRKPDPRIYEMMCETLGADPGACIYLDDLGINCKPASRLGMHAIKVTSGEQALADLSAVLGVELP